MQDGSEASSRWGRRLGRVLFGLAGLAGLGLLVHHVGARSVLDALGRGLPWLPLLLAVEGARLGVEAATTGALYAQLGERPRARALLRAQLLAYWVFVLSPMGRTAAEVTKALLLSRDVGADRATSVALVAQGSALAGTALFSLPCVLAAAVRPEARILAWAVGAQAIGVAALAALLLWGARQRKVGRLAGWVLSKLGVDDRQRERLPELVRSMRPFPWRVILGYAASRGLSAVLFLCAIAALGGGLRPLGALRAMGVSLLGAAAVDFVPGDVGLTEGAFTLFHEGVGVGVADAVTLGLLFHATQLVWVAVSALAATVWDRSD